MSWNITGSIGCKLVPRGRSWRLPGTRLGMKVGYQSELSPAKTAPMAATEPRSNSESGDVCGQNASHRPRSRNDHCLPTHFAILHNRSTRTTCWKLKLLLKRSTTCSAHRTFEGECTATKMCQAKLLQGMRFELHIILSTYLCLFRLSFLGVFGRTWAGESFGGRTT